MAKPLTGKVCLVTGGTRGIGRGIALQLGEAGATVYVTGRTLKNPNNQVGGSLEDTAKEIEARGGVCVPVQCDHTVDDQVAAVFDQIRRDRDGQLDILVNNAYAAVKAIARNTGKKFWEQEEGMWDTVNGVGLRNHYMCTIHAARMMVPRKQGLIVNVSSFGGLRYLFNTAYGVGKAAVDRMAVDCAIDLRKHKVAMVSLWPGPVKTEEIAQLYSEQTVKEGLVGEKIKSLFEEGESVEFPGKCIVSLFQDPSLMKKSGRILMTSDLANEYNLLDINGKKIPDFRSLSSSLRYAGWKKTSAFVPGFIRIPHFVYTLIGSKF